MRIGHRGGQEPVYGITTAEQSHTDEITRRQKQYILTMLIRVVSIVVVVAVPGISWQIKVLLILLATVIPYIAVVRANGGPVPEKDPTNLLLAPPDKPALEHDQLGLPGTGPVVSGEADEATDPAGGDEAWERGETAHSGGTAQTGETDEHRVPADAPKRAGGAAGRGDATNSRVYSEH
ncbi:MAG TPA: DUF3099 domain-containing protein [Actinocrinis sp.]|uniref:DUF3099 domain-containing protein n=1 Tax=Actinocrinis sp. TaxID=1920516 RepID=UPI002DDCF0BF|nr:DUF3099 domain-containing protein [Actinocrinis sp.]HEV3171814.1 DUF3099 domain-containing protein [Actinocrinis sp.]